MSSETTTHKFTDLATLEVEDETYKFYQTLVKESGKTYYGLGLEESAMCDGCDVQELPHDIAAKILARLCGVYVYHAETHESIADYSMGG